MNKNFHWTIFIGIIFISTTIFLTWHFLHKSPERGSFGDMFGISTSIFSGLAFIGATYTLILQSEQLKIQQLNIIQLSNQIETSNKSHRLNTLRISMEIVESAIANKSNNNQDQELIALKEKKKSIELEIYRIINETLKDKGN